MVKSPLKQEIQHLERRLKDQLSVRYALEQAMGYSSIYSSLDSLCSSMPKPTKELIREISVLEVEVSYLEHHLLSLYRKAFDQQMPITSPKEKIERPLQEKLESCDKLVAMPNQNKSVPYISQEMLAGPRVHRCQSALSRRYSEESIARALQTCYSQPLNSFHSTTSLAEYLGTNIVDHIPETPNTISEDMVRCMGNVYCKLADLPVAHHFVPSSSPSSSLSSTSASSPQHYGDIWSRSYRRESNLDPRLVNPFNVEGVREFNSPYNAMVAVTSVCKNRLDQVEHLLHTYKSLVYRLRTIDPRKMKNEEKLAFWINIHNALMMHAYLVYSVPKKNTKESLLIKATCIIAGRSVSAYTIQCYLLGCRTYSPSQWFWTLLSPKMKLKMTRGDWRAFAIERNEPLLHFALCSGSRSDPAVRMYTCKNVFQQLETAKDEYIRATVGISRQEKILIPKLIDSYSKERNISTDRLLDMIKDVLSSETLPYRCQHGRARRMVEWMPHDIAFRYLLSPELMSLQIH